MTNHQRIGRFSVVEENNIIVAIDCFITPELREEGIIRETIRLIQDERKNKQLNITDIIEVYIDSKDTELKNILSSNSAKICKETLANFLYVYIVDPSLEYHKAILEIYKVGDKAEKDKVDIEISIVKWK